MENDDGSGVCFVLLCACVYNNIYVKYAVKRWKRWRVKDRVVWKEINSSIFFFERIENVYRHVDM